MRMERVDLKAEVMLNGKYYSLSGFNCSRYSDELVLYSPAFGQHTRTNQWGYEVVIKDGQVIKTQSGNSVIPKDGFVLSAHGMYKSLLTGLKVGDRVEINLELTPDWLKEGVVEAIGAGPRLVENGIIRITGEEEKFLPDILNGRAPRTALGITPTGNLLMVVVDGRSEYSIGLTLQELAETMIALGASQAMNLDGGKSSTLVIRDRVFNSPPTGEIVVHNGLVLIYKKRFHSNIDGTFFMGYFLPGFDLNLLIFLNKADYLSTFLQEQRPSSVPFYHGDSHGVWMKGYCKRSQ